MPALMQLQGPRNLGCCGRNRVEAAQAKPIAPAMPVTPTPLSGAVGGILAASPFTMLIGFAAGAFIAWNWVLPKTTSEAAARGISGHRSRKRRRR
jgi:hypothetical protein